MQRVQRTACPSCHGDGFFVSDGGPGRFVDSLESFVPAETLIRCDTCAGEGEIEVCAHCLEPLTIDLDLGLEVCACVTESLPRAA